LTKPGQCPTFCTEVSQFCPTRPALLQVGMTTQTLAVPLYLHLVMFTIMHQVPMDSRYI